MVPFAKRQADRKSRETIAMEKVPLIITNRQFQVVGTSSNSGFESAFQLGAGNLKSNQ